MPFSAKRCNFRISLLFCCPGKHSTVQSISKQMTPISHASTLLIFPGSYYVSDPSGVLGSPCLLGIHSLPHVPDLKSSKNIRVPASWKPHVIYSIQQIHSRLRWQPPRPPPTKGSWVSRRVVVFQLCLSWAQRKGFPKTLWLSHEGRTSTLLGPSVIPWLLCYPRMHSVFLQVGASF